MYYNDLKNAELRTYHHYTKIEGFNISLSSMQNSKLFKVENIGNDLYKIYPLFYVDEIRCNMSNVKILDNKCVILHETETSSNQTYISFINHEDIDSYNHRTYLAGNTTGGSLASKMPYLNVGDTLTTANYNNLVQVIRDNITLNNPIKIRNGLIHGLYGDYQFNMTDVSLTDKGILITDETLSNEVTVTLLNPVYQHSTYTLILTVATISDVHLDNSSTDNYYDTTPLEVTLNPNTTVTIPIENLEENRVILYDAIVQVKHDKSYMQQIEGITSIDVNTTGYIVDGTTLQAKCIGESVSGKTITFKMKKAGSSTLTTLGTATTDSTGVATYTVTSSQLSTPDDYIFYAVSSNGLTVYSNTISYSNYSTELVIDSINYDEDNHILTASGRWVNTDTNTLVPVSRVLNVSWDNGGSSGITNITDGNWSYTKSEVLIMGSTSVSFSINNMSGVVGYNQPSKVSSTVTGRMYTTLTKQVDTYNQFYFEVRVEGYLKTTSGSAVANRTVYVTIRTNYSLNSPVPVTTDKYGYYVLWKSYNPNTLSLFLFAGIKSLIIILSTV